MARLDREDSGGKKPEVPDAVGEFDERIRIEKAAEAEEKSIREQSTKVAIDKSLSRKDASWILPLLAIVGFTWLVFGMLGLEILAIFIALLPVAIYFMAGEQIWFMSVPQNAAVAIMWGSGKNSRLQRLACVIGNDIFALNAAAERVEVYWFEKKYNIWWMGPLGSVHRYHTVEIEQYTEGVEVAGTEEIGNRRRTVTKIKDNIEINKEIVLPLIIPPIPCKENFDVTLDSAAFYFIRNAQDALKALFEVGNLSIALNKKFEIALKEKTGNMTYDELRSEKESVKAAAWEKMKEDGDFDAILKNWGTDIRDIGIMDITAEKDAAVALKNVAIAGKAADAMRKKGEGERDYDKLRGDGEEYRTTKQYAGFAAGYALVTKIADGAGIEMEKLRTLQIMPSTKIISMPDFTGALSSVTGKSAKTLAADLIAAGFTLEQFHDEFVKVKQMEEQKVKVESEPPKPEAKAENKKEQGKK